MWTDIPTWTEWQTASAPFHNRLSGKTWLKEVDTALRRYHQAGRRVDNLRRLRDAVTDWYIDQSGIVDPQADPVRAELGKVAKKKWSQLTSMDRGYQQVVCIAYETELGTPDGKYLGDANDDAGDLEQRWKHMQKAIDIAYKKYNNVTKRHPQLVEEHRRLKIFMAPEFYFRGGSGAYNIELWMEFLDKIPEYTRRAEYRDWLFVLGTFVCHTPEERHHRVAASTLENYALVQKGGFSGRDNVHDIQVAKEFPSHVDFEQPPSTSGKKGRNWYRPGREAYIGGKRTEGLSPPGSREFHPELARSGPNMPEARYLGTLSEEVEGGYIPPADETGAFGCIFTMDGILFGLEVCRDHVHGRLQAAEDTGGVKVQLIPACGATIDDGPCLGRAIVFNVDGNEGTSEVLDAESKWVKKLFTSYVPQDTKYFPGPGLIRGYRPVNLP
jgi:hypothetical protein